MTAVARQFSRAADYYRDHAVVQQRVAKDLLSGIESFESNLSILEIGCGTGFFTELLLRKFPEINMHALDVAPLMIDVAKNSLGPELASRVEWLEESTGNVGIKFDRIVSSSALHWIVPFSKAAMQLHNILKPGGEIEAAVMLRGTLEELHDIRETVAPRKRPAARLPNANLVREYFLSAGFDNFSIEEKDYIDLFPSAKEFLRSIHKMGLTGGAYSQGSGLLNRTELSRLMAEYQAKYRNFDGRTYATYRVGFVSATKPR